MIPMNYVAIKQAPDFTDVAGLPVVDNDSIHKPNYGEVVHVPASLHFQQYPGKYAERSVYLDSIRQKARKRSLDSLTKMDLKIGDIVMYKYIFGIDDEERFQDLIFVPYDQIFCKVNPVQMLNDYCLIEPDESFVDKLGGHFEKYRKGSGILKHRCRGEIKYADYPHVTEAPPEGSKVYFKWTSAPKMEANIHQKMNTTGNYSLLKIKSKDITYFIEKP